VLLVIAGCVAAFASSGEIPFVTVDKGAISGIREPTFVSVLTDADWQELWHRHDAAKLPPRPLPRVDFTAEMVVAVFAGEKSTGGHAIEIARVEEQESPHELRVFYRQSAPSPGGVVLQALTQPFHFVRMKRVVAPVAFIAQ
jgi:hypothetical protein